MSSRERTLTAHLTRRAGFGATPDELDRYVETGYEMLVEEFLHPGESQHLHPGESQHLPDDLLYRRFINMPTNQSSSYKYWGYRMTSTTCPLEEKIALFWKCVFATGYSKLNHGKALINQIDMFRQYGMGRFDDLLVELSKDPAMLVWLDNHENHKGAINENYGREILELFSMGVGNYTEDDIKECARAFTGWTMGNAEYMAVMSQKDSIWPYGRINRHFEFRAYDHDDGEKVFLGERGRFNGEDVIDIICRQPATATFISRHLYNFFVADEAPVPQWAQIPPRDPEAIEVLSQAYVDSGHEIRSMLRVLFNSDFFKEAQFARVKSPIELVIGTLRMTGEFRELRPGDLRMDEAMVETGFMGQDLMNPPSVEGWHTGKEWINSGALVDRVNFAAKHMADLSNPGVKEIVDRIARECSDTRVADNLVDTCLEAMGPITVSDVTRDSLVQVASRKSNDEGGNGHSEHGDDNQRIVDVLKMIVASREYQLC